MRVTVIGGGSWGTAFSVVLREHGHDVTLACRSEEQAFEIMATGRNPRYLSHVDLTGVTFLDSAGLCVLAAAHRRAVRSDVRLRVLASSRAVIRPMAETNSTISPTWPFAGLRKARRKAWRAPPKSPRPRKWRKERSTSTTRPSAPFTTRSSRPA